MDFRNKLKDVEKWRLKAAPYALQPLQRQPGGQKQSDKYHEEMNSMKRQYHEYHEYEYHQYHEYHEERSRAQESDVGQSEV